MGILEEDVARVREATDFVAVASQHMQLKKVGRRYSGLCPFHGEKTPSFSVNAEQGLYYCFGCGVKGDAIRFVQELEHVDFPGAVEYLAAKAGISLRYDDAAQSEGHKTRAILIDAMEKAVDWYHQRLLTAPDAGAARRYLRNRGLTGEEVRAYRIGWAPDDWDVLTKALGLPTKVLTDSGLGFVNSRGRANDFFRARILFPIFDAQGKPLAFGGRKMPDAEGPKYRNTSETKLYSKSKVLYGLNWAKDAIVAADEVIVCEGYTDVIGFAAAGAPRAVATCGTSLTEEHVRLLKRFARKLVLAFDPDAAGQAAAERVYEWEKKLEIDVAIADLPPGQDPGDLSRSDPDRLRRAVEESIPFLGFRVERALAAGNMSSPEGRARAAEAAVAVIAEHPDELVRDQYVMQVADRSRIEVDRLRTSLRSGGRASVATPAPRPQAGGRNASNERRILRLAVDAEHGRETLAMLDEVLFVEDRYLRAFRLLRDVDGDLYAAIVAADPTMADGLQRMAVEDTIDDPRDIRRALLRDAGTRCRDDLRRLADSADDPAIYVSAISWLQAQLSAIREEEHPGQDVEDQLLAWLSEQAEERA